MSKLGLIPPPEMFSTGQVDGENVPDDVIDDKERFIMDRIFCGFLPDQKLMDLKKTLVKELRELIEEIPEETGGSIAADLEVKSKKLIKDIKTSFEKLEEPPQQLGVPLGVPLSIPSGKVGNITTEIEEYIQ